MATLPCDADGQCMVCRGTPSDEEKLTCVTCGTPWHATCLVIPPVSLSSTVNWLCPDCDFTVPSSSTSSSLPKSDGLVAKIKEIEADGTLTELEKARRRQELVSGIHADVENEDKDNHDNNKNSNNNEVLEILDSNVKCVCCMNLPERPVTAPCGHNTCLKCFQKWIGRGNRTCAHCRATIPQKIASQPRINSSLVAVIRMARIAKSNSQVGPSKVCHFVQNQNRPDKAFTTERAQKKGKANAASGKIFVTVPPDHFGPILADNDPERNQGVLVGECWEDRLECRQWGAHLPHVAGIAGQSKYGAQSVVLSGGYQDDEDHGEWFLYTGSGGRDLSGNKRTNKEQSFDQEFAHYNEALRVSCLKGYPVRVVRSHKEKRSSYAPEKGLRYDGVYRIEMCWQKHGVQGHKVCRYLFVRCDNDPAPWTSDENGDRPRPLPIIEELAQATRISERKEQPSWDFDGKEAQWKWKKPPPLSQKSLNAGNSEGRKMVKARKSQNITVRQQLLKEFGCLICKQVMTLPVTSPCAHNFCKACLEGVFAGQALVRERNRGGRTLRTQKNIIKCPACPTDISDFYLNHQVNREMMDVIESLKRKSEEIDDAGEGSDEEGIAAAIEKNPEETDAGAASKRAKTGDSQDVSSTKDRSENDVQDVPVVDAPKMDEGRNDSPTSPLHVGSENELDQP